MIENDDKIWGFGMVSPNGETMGISKFIGEEVHVRVKDSTIHLTQEQWDAFVERVNGLDRSFKEKEES